MPTTETITQTERSGRSHHDGARVVAGGTVRETTGRSSSGSSPCVHRSEKAMRTVTVITGGIPYARSGPRLQVFVLEDLRRPPVGAPAAFLADLFVRGPVLRLHIASLHDGTLGPCEEPSCTTRHPSGMRREVSIASTREADDQARERSVLRTETLRGVSIHGVVVRRTGMDPEHGLAPTLTALENVELSLLRTELTKCRASLPLVIPRLPSLGLAARSVS